MASGVTVSQCCLDEFENLKMGKKIGYIIFKMSPDNKKIIVDCTGASGASYDEFKEKLIEAGESGQGRYGCFDVQNATKSGASKIVFIMWLPDENLKIKEKMLYTSSKKAIRDKLLGIAAEMQCNCEDDLAFSSIAASCQSKYV